MRLTTSFFACAGALTLLGAPLYGQTDSAWSKLVSDSARDPGIRELVGRLELEKYKATIKGLTQFGDRRQGTKRNRDAVDWIETQLKSYGCTPTERIIYTYTTPARGGAGRGGDSTGRGAAGGRGAGDSTGRGANGGRGGGRGGAGGGRGAAGDSTGARAGGGGRGSRTNGPASGGGTLRGVVTRTGVNTDSLKQTDLKLRALNAEPTSDGERQEVFCTKIGTTHPDEMYIVGGHMDGHGWGEAANDDGSGTAIVMELARIFSSPDVTTDRSVRFILWNNEESGLNGARAYVAQRQALQGKENPPGSGKYPEPKWLGMVQHDMMMFDHGMPNADSTMRKEQRPEADVNVEFAIASKFAEQSMKLAFVFHRANSKYATDYPAQVGPHMTNTDSDPFKDIIPAISLRENERGRDIGAGWDPQWHQVTDVYATYNDKDFRLGLNAAQTTLSAIGWLTGVKLK